MRKGFLSTTLLISSGFALYAFASPIPMRVQKTTHQTPSRLKSTTVASHNNLVTDFDTIRTLKPSVRRAIERVDQFVENKRQRLSDIARLKLNSLLLATTLAEKGFIPQMSGFERIGAIDDEGNYCSHYLYQNTILELADHGDEIDRILEEAKDIRLRLIEHRANFSQAWIKAFDRVNKLVEDSIKARKWTITDSSDHPHQVVPALAFMTRIESFLPEDFLIQQSEEATAIADRYATASAS